MNLEEHFALIAPCGMNCAGCLAFQREKKHCPGCRTASGHPSASISACIIRNCATFADGDAEYCFACEKFPCKRLKALDKRYRTRYQMSMIENLANIREYGIEEFARHERVRWACCECGGTICIHRGRCKTCG